MHHAELAILLNALHHVHDLAVDRNVLYNVTALDTAFSATLTTVDNKCSAAAEMGDRARAKWAEKWGPLCPFRGGIWVPIYHNATWAETCLRTKWYPDS